MSGLHCVDVGLRDGPLNNHGNVIHAASLSDPILDFSEYQRLHRRSQLMNILGRVEGRIGGPCHKLPQTGHRIRRDRGRAADGDPLGKPRVSRVCVAGKGIHFLRPKISNPGLGFADELNLAVLAHRGAVQAPQVAWPGRRIHHQ